MPPKGTLRSPDVENAAVLSRLGLYLWRVGFRVSGLRRFKVSVLGAHGSTTRLQKFCETENRNGPQISKACPTARPAGFIAQPKHLNPEPP